MDWIEAALDQRHEGIRTRIVWRVKSAYSIYRKMKLEQKASTVMDVFGFMWWSGG